MECFFLDYTSFSGYMGVVICMSPYPQNSSPDKRYVWVTIFFQERLLGFFSIYSPNLSFSRSYLWDWMASSLPDADWIVGGDFNRVE